MNECTDAATATADTHVIPWCVMHSLVVVFASILRTPATSNTDTKCVPVNHNKLALSVGDHVHTELLASTRRINSCSTSEMHASGGR